MATQRDCGDRGAAVRGRGAAAVCRGGGNCSAPMISRVVETPMFKIFFRTLDHPVHLESTLNVLF